MSTNTQAFSPELCAFLSSLAPGFEGHWYYIEEDAYAGDGKYGKKIRLVCLGKDEELKLHQQIICPAWQAEDVLRNWKTIFKNFHNKCCDEDLSKPSTTANDIAKFLVFNPDTAYQKIEEYLWSILK